MSNNSITNNDDDDSFLQQSAGNSGSSPITQDQYEKLVNLILNFSPGQNPAIAISNQVDSSSFTGHSPINRKVNPPSFVYVMLLTLRS